MEVDNVEITFDIPGKDAPGYVNRMQRRATWEKAREERPNEPSTINDFINYLADFVLVPEDRKEAKRLLREMSKTQFDEAMNAIFSVPDAEVDPEV